MVHSGIRFATPRERLMKSVNTRVFRHTRSAALTLHLPLRRLALCLDCEACFEIGIPSCPACGGDTWVLLAKFLDQGPLKVLPQFHPFPKSWTEGLFFFQAEDGIRDLTVTGVQTCALPI